MLVVHFALGELLQASHKRKATLFAKDGPRFVSLNGSPVQCHTEPLCGLVWMLIYGVLRGF